MKLTDLYLQAFAERFPEGRQLGLRRVEIEGRFACLKKKVGGEYVTRGYLHGTPGGPRLALHRGEHFGREALRKFEDWAGVEILVDITEL